MRSLSWIHAVGLMFIVGLIVYHQKTVDSAYYRGYHAAVTERHFDGAGMVKDKSGKTVCWAEGKVWVSSQKDTCSSYDAPRF